MEHGALPGGGPRGRWGGRGRAGLAAAGVAVLTVGAVLAVPSAASAGTTLGEAAAARGRYFGAAVDGSRLSTEPYGTILNREFRSVTPQRELTAEITQPQRGQFAFGPADRIVAHARANGMRVRGHTLAWHTHQPPWMRELSGAALRQAMIGHVQAVAGRYRGEIHSWDVVKEAFADGTRGIRRDSNLQRTGDDWIEVAFRAARTADPNARLCYSDYGIEDWTQPKTQAVFRMVLDFKRRGVPIDCVGFQSRFDSGRPYPGTYRTTLRNFADLGLEVQITELAVPGAVPTTYRDVVSDCLAVVRCSGMTVWGVMDDDSPWGQLTDFSLFDRAGREKPAYHAILEVLTGAPAPACG